MQWKWKRMRNMKISTEVQISVAPLQRFYTPAVVPPLRFDLNVSKCNEIKYCGWQRIKCHFSIYYNLQITSPILPSNANCWGILFWNRCLATALNAADLTPVVKTGVTDAFCYRDRLWRTDAPCEKGEAHRDRQRGVINGISRLLCLWPLLCPEKYLHWSI